MEEAKATARAAAPVVLTLARKCSLLHAIATARKLDVKDRMRATELDARLAGEFAERIDLSVKQVLAPEQVLAAGRRSPALLALQHERN